MSTYKYTAKNNGYTATLSLTPGAQNIAENTSVVEYKLELTAGASYFQYWPIGWEIWLGGSQTAYQARSGAPQKSIAAYGTITLCSGSTTIAHNADGTKNMSISFRVDGGTAAVYLPGTIRYTGGETLELPTIPRASELSLSADSVLLNGSAGSVTVTVAPHSGNFSHKVGYTFGSVASEEISLSAGKTTAALSFPMSLLNEIPRSANGVAIVTLTTYNGGTAIGTTRANLTITAGQSVVPSISAVTVTREGQTSLDMFIKGYDRARIQTTAVGAYGSTISSYEVTGGLSGASVLTGVLWTVGQNTWTVKVTDTRGRTATEKVSITVVDYATPAISGAVFERCTADGTPDDDGTFLRVSAEISISSCNGENSCTAKVLYKLQTEEEWTQAGVFTETSAVYDIGLTDAAYDVRLIATDKLSSGIAEASLDVGDVIVDYDPDTHCLDILAEKVRISGVLEIDGIPPACVVAEGTKGIWRYRKWSNGDAECWGTYSDTVAVTKNLSGAYYSDEITVDYPFEFVSSPVRVVSGGSDSKINWVRSFGVNAVGYAVFLVIALEEQNTAEISVNLHAFGKWKE